MNHPHMDFVIEALLDLPSVTPQNAKYRKEARRWKNKALKQKRVLDKIRAEIDDLTYYWCEVHPRNVIDDVLEIIDKHKTGSEG